MKKPGVLLIHGFTSHRSSLEALIPELDKRGVEWQYPILAGHGGSPKNLADKRWPDWQNDVEQGFIFLRQTNERVVIVALSMGTLLAMELAVNHPEAVAGLVLLSPCIKFKNKLSRLTPILSRVVKIGRLPINARYSSPQYAREDKSHDWFPTAPFHSYWQRTQTITAVIRQVRCPVLILQSKADRVADPRGAQIIYDLLPGTKELLWHERSGHEMLLDAEAEAVLQEIISFSPLNES